MDDVILTRAIRDDLDEVLKVISDIVLELFPHYYGLEHRNISIHKTEERIKDEIERGMIYKVIIKSKNELIGALTINDGEIESMYLMPFYQKKGYGRILLNIVENEKQQIIS